jgi:hypothetical protein
MVLNTEWTQLEIIELLNETLSSTSFSSSSTTINTTPAAAAASANLNRKNGAAVASVAGSPQVPSSNKLVSSSGASGGSGVGGFGFGITGNKSTGVVVKAITPGGSAFRVSCYFFYLLKKSLRRNVQF